MDFFLLPEKIKARLSGLDGKALSVFNSSGGLDGVAGECYLVADESSVRLFHKTFGEDSYAELNVNATAPGFGVRTIRDKFNILLEVSSGLWSHKLKFSSFDAAKLDALCAKFARKSPAKGSPAEQGDDAQVELDPFSGLLAAAMFVAGNDGSIDAAEDYAIRQLAGDDRKALASALKVYKSCEPLALASALAPLERESRLCILANMLDVAVCDGVLRSSEQAFIESFSAAMGLRPEDYSTFRDVLLVKGRSAFLKGQRQGA